MALVKWEPERRREPLQRLRGLWHALPVSRLGRRLFAPLLGEFVPAVELEETDEEIILRAEVPGIRRSDLEIDVQETQVSIRGVSRSERRSSDSTYYHKESVYGTFSRVVELPAEVVPEKSMAKLEKGILTVTLSKADPSKHKSVNVIVQ